MPAADIEPSPVSTDRDLRSHPLRLVDEHHFEFQLLALSSPKLLPAPSTMSSYPSKPTPRRLWIEGLR